MTFRVYAFGLKGLNPAVVNSMTTILESGLVQQAENLSVYYELKPNIDSIHNGAPFRTNSRGLADQEYALAKPDGVFRVAVVGSSWTMPSGAEIGVAWHSVLEDRYNLHSKDIRYEFINFGVEFYGLEEIIGTTRHKALKYEPDLIIAGLTATTTAILREPHTQPFVPTSKRNPFFESLASSALGLPWVAGIRRPAPASVSNADQWRAQTITSIRELHAIATSANAELAIVWLGFRPMGKNYRAVMEQLGVPVSLAYEPISTDRGGGWFETFADIRFQTSRFDLHPNALAHGLIADKVQTDLVNSGLLPAVNEK